MRRLLSLLFLLVALCAGGCDFLGQDSGDGDGGGGGGEDQTLVVDD